MRATTQDQLTATEQLALREALQSVPLVSALNKICNFEQRAADERCRDESLGGARVNVTAQFAARARVFAEFLFILKDRVQTLSAPVRE